MSWEAIWYQDYDVDGTPPYCRRLNRLSRHDQWQCIIDLAISLQTGTAGYRPMFTQRPASGVEEYWYWHDAPFPDPWVLKDEGLAAREIADVTGRSAALVWHLLRRPPSRWWMIPRHVANAARELIEEATRCECQRGRGSADPDNITGRLRIWRRSGHWRRYVRTGWRAPSLQGGYAAWERATFSPRRRRRKVAA